MQVVCTICSELVNQTENIHATKCGHVFHHHCLMQWINISQTCPQCRNYVTHNDIFRLYLTMENSTEDVSLKAKLESMKLELQSNKELAARNDQENASIIKDLLANVTNLKDYEIKVAQQENEIKALQLKIKDCNETINKQNKHIAIMLPNTIKHVDMCGNLLSECEEKIAKREHAAETLENLLGVLLKTCEEKLISRKLAVAALEEEMNYVKKQNLEIDALRREKVELEEKLQALNGRVKKLAVLTLKRRKQKRKASDDESDIVRIVKRKRSSIYSAIDDAVFNNDDRTGYPSTHARLRSKKMGTKSENIAINTRPRVLRTQPKIELNREDNKLPNEASNIFEEYAECDMLQHLQFQLQIC